MTIRTLFVGLMLITSASCAQNVLPVAVPPAPLPSVPAVLMEPPLNRDLVEKILRESPSSEPVP